MEETKLRALLQELHQELETAESVEPQSRRLLSEVLGDIQGVLDSTESDGEDSSFSEQLQHAVVEFENNHPRIAFTIERLIQSLANMGI